MRRLAVLIATVGGAGYFPIAPGTVGSFVGLVIFFLTHRWPLVWQLALLGAVTVAGVWAADVAARHFSHHDPRYVIVDEVAGQMLTLVGTGVGPAGALAGFVIFRVMDIIKPWPARRFESLPGGLGVMADDLMAAVYGNLILQVAVRFVYAVG